MSLLLQLLLQASRFFMEADCTPLHLTCCRQAALVALQLRAVELQLSRECLQHQQQQQQRNGRHLVSLLLQHCSKALETSLHPFKDAEVSLKDGTDLPVLLSSLTSNEAPAAAASASVCALRMRTGEADAAAAAADVEQQQRSAWFNSLLFSLEGSALQWFGRGDKEERRGGSTEAPAAKPAATAGAAEATPAATAAAAAAEAVKESEERAAASVGLIGPYLQFLHLSIAQVLLFVELHPDAFVSGLTAEVRGGAEKTPCSQQHGKGLLQQQRKRGDRGRSCTCVHCDQRVFNLVGSVCLLCIPALGFATCCCCCCCCFLNVGISAHLWWSGAAGLATCGVPTGHPWRAYVLPFSASGQTLRGAAAAANDSSSRHEVCGVSSNC